MLNLDTVKYAVRMPTNLGAVKHSCEPCHSVLISLALNNIIEMIAFMHNRTLEPSPIHDGSPLSLPDAALGEHESYTKIEAICKCHILILRRHAVRRAIGVHVVTGNLHHGSVVGLDQCGD